MTPVYKLETPRYRVTWKHMTDTVFYLVLDETYNAVHAQVNEQAKDKSRLELEAVKPVYSLNSHNIFTFRNKLSDTVYNQVLDEVWNPIWNQVYQAKDTSYTKTRSTEL